MKQMNNQILLSYMDVIIHALTPMWVYLIFPKPTFY